MKNVAIEVVENKRPVDLLIVEDQRVESGAPVVVFRAERQDRRLTFVWRGVTLVDRPAEEAEMLCRPIDFPPPTLQREVQEKNLKYAVYLPPLDREARYLLGYSSVEPEMHILLQVKGEGLDWFRTLPITPSDSPSVQMFGDTPASQR